MGCLGLGCVPWPWLRAHGDYLGLGCMPWLWQHAHGGLLWPSPWQHAHGQAALALALASCLLPMRGCLSLGNMPMGAALALVACPGLGNLPMGAASAFAACLGIGYMPMGAALALATCLGLGYVPQPWQRAHGGLPWPWLLHAPTLVDILIVFIILPILSCFWLLNYKFQNPTLIYKIRFGLRRIILLDSYMMLPLRFVKV